MNVYAMAGDERLPSPASGDTLKVMIAMVANLVLLFAVNAMSAVEPALFGDRQLSLAALAAFDIATLTLIAYFGLLVAADKLEDLLVLLVRSVRSDAAEGRDWRLQARRIAGDDAGQTHKSEPNLIRRIASSLWVPTTINFVIVAGLIYASGGIGGSPYFPVPLAMMAIGQCLYRAPSIDLGSGGPARRLIVFVVCMGRLYRYPLLMVTILLVIVERLQEVHPLATRLAPTAEIVITTLLSLFATMCVTFITRRADQAKVMGPEVP